MDNYNLDQTGQHYMVDKTLVRFIVDNANLKQSDIVLEIGYGKGILTKELAKRCKLIAIDIEKSDVKANAIFVHGNILEKIEDLYKKYKFNKIVANIPYNISEPLMRKLFKTQIESCILTMGKNFSDILTKKDNRMGIIANHLFEIKILKNVPPKAFFPMPRVNSCVIELTQRKTNSIYRKIVLLDDLKLKNSLEKTLPLQKRRIKELLKDDWKDKKLYALSNAEFIELDKILHETFV